MNLRGDLGWIYFAAKRFSLAGRKGAGAFAARLSTLGICFGVMTLIVVISVMNGFQSEFIDAIMEVSSFHARVQSDGKNGEIMNFLSRNKKVLLAEEFLESESLAASDSGKQAAVLVRGVDSDIMERDAGFRRELKLRRGKFFLDKKSAVLGSGLARALGVRVGDTVSLYSIASSRPLLESLSKPQEFVVQGIFSTGYAEINSSCAFVEKNAAKEFFNQAPLIVGVKLKNSALDFSLKKELLEAFPGAAFESWREYNRSFFGALKVEKNMLMLLVVLIFLTVAVNIYNYMRRVACERRFEISALSALGGKAASIKSVFVMRGLLAGVRGSFLGLALGMFFCANIKSVFAALSGAMYFFQKAFALFFDAGLAATMAENSMFYVYGRIPARMRLGEIAFITLFGIFSAVVSSWAASREVLAAPISEVLHDE